MLQDLRFLYMAKAIEEMFEGLERGFQSHLAPGAVRDAVAPIFKDGPSHTKLKQAYTDLNARIAQAQGAIQPTDLLEAMLACEKTAQKFYEDHAKDLSQPDLADIFLGLAKEEAQHVRAVERALALQNAIPR